MCRRIASSRGLPVPMLVGAVIGASLGERMAEETRNISGPSARAGLRFERRGVPRFASEGGAMASFVMAGGTSRLVRVELRDASSRGVGVRCGEAVEVGAVFSLFPEDAFASVSRGRVVRCVREGEGYRLGLARLIRHAA